MKYTEGGKGRISKTGFLLSRFVRLTPQLAIFILLTTLIPTLGSGPIWNQHISPIVDNCINYGWRNLLYIQTFFDTKDMVNSYHNIYFDE